MRIGQSFLVVAAGVVCVMGSAWGAVGMKEDLRGCALPHGEVVVPAAGTFEAAGGEFLKLSDGTFVAEPSTWQGRGKEAVEAMRGRHDADLAFLPEDGGTLWAVSGRIVDVGSRFLYEAAAMKLDRPEVIPGSGKRPEGAITEVQEGRTFLMETTEGKFALVRVLEVSKVGVNVQYVYQPSGVIGFDVKKGAFEEVTAVTPLREPAKKRSGVTVAGTPAVTQPATQVAVKTVSREGMVLRGSGLTTAPAILEQGFSVHMRQRELMIESRMKVLKGEAKTPEEVQRKVDAIQELAALHAEGAADELVRQVTFLNPRGAGAEFQESVHPCFAALKRMGKAGSAAAVKGLRELDLNGNGEGLESPGYRAGLLTLVVRAVEGDELGLFILRRERNGADSEKRRLMFDRLIGPETKEAGK